MFIFFKTYFCFTFIIQARNYRVFRYTYIKGDLWSLRFVNMYDHSKCCIYLRVFGYRDTRIISNRNIKWWNYSRCSVVFILRCDNFKMAYIPEIQKWKCRLCPVLDIAHRNFICLLKSNFYFGCTFQGYMLQYTFPLNISETDKVVGH